jgi:hypothetical protein
MADKFYSVVLGEQLPVQVTEGSSSSSEAIELRVNDSVFPYKGDVIRAVDAIKAFLVTRETTPIA